MSERQSIPFGSSGAILPVVIGNNQDQGQKPKPRGTGYSKPIDAAKEAVTVLELVERLGARSLSQRGGQYEACCPLPDHDDHTPSFRIYPDTRSWCCFGCSRGGDVVDLAALCWGYADHQPAMAAANLLHEFGHELPQRPASWHRKKARQARAREAIEQAKIDRVASLVFRFVFRESVEAVGDAKHAQEASRKIARMLVVARRGEAA